MNVPEGFRPESVIRPSSVEGVVDALQEAGEAGRLVAPMGRGGGSGPLPPEGPFDLLSLEGLAGVEEHEPGDLTFTARPGTTLHDLDRVLAPHGQWLPVDPAAGGDRTLGGVVAGGLGGALHAGYGAVRDQVLGLSVVTGDGRRLRLGGRVMKNVAGFDLVRLLVGSRGELGVVVSISMRLFPRPRAERVLVVDGRADRVIMDAARAVATAPVVPAAAVLVGGGGPLGAALVVRLHGAEEAVEADRRTLEGVMGEAFRAVEGDEAARLLERSRELGTGGTLAWRQAGLPAELPLRWQGFRSAFPGAGLRADVLSGGLRGALTGPVDRGAVEDVRRVARSNGRPALFTAVAPELRTAVEPWAGPDDGGLGKRLRTHFDPGGVLAPGRFGR